MTRAYRAMLRLLPSDLRRQFGDEILDTASRLSRSPRYETRRGRLRLFLALTFDTLAAAWRERPPCRQLAAAARITSDQVRKYTLKPPGVAGMRSPEASPHATIGGGMSPRRPRQSRRAASAIVDSVFREVRYALRSLRRSPTFTASAIVTLALGIGANATAFSFVNAVVLRPLPYEDPDELLYVYGAGFRFDNFDQYAQADSFSEIAAHGTRPGVLAGENGRRPIGVMPVTATFFDVLGVTAAHGRVLVAGDHQAGGEAVAVISHRLASEQFGNPQTAVGATLNVDDVVYVVAGVMPPAFFVRDPDFGDVWVPAEPTARNAAGVARLRPNTTLEQALAEIEPIAQRADIPEESRSLFTRLIRILPIREIVFLGNERQNLLVLTGVVTLLLLIACANVANLLLARAAERDRELAVRAALGASRLRLAGAVMVESSVLALTAAASGALLARWATPALLAAQPRELPRQEMIAVDAAVLLFTFGIALGSALLFGLAPALRRTGSSGGSIHGIASMRERGSRRLRATLVVGEVAIAVALLIGTGLLLRTYLILSPNEPGFEWRDKLCLYVALPEDRYADHASQRAFFERLFDELRALPGVEEVSAVTNLPLTGVAAAFRVPLEGDETGDRPPLVFFRSATPGYLGSMKVPIVRGRGIEPTDRAGTTPVALVNETLARSFWPDTDPLGQRLRMPTTTRGEVDLEIVGVVGDVWFSGGSTVARPEVFVPYAQEGGWYLSVVVQGPNPASLQQPALRSLLDLDPMLLPPPPRTLAYLLSDAVAEPRYRFAIVGMFASLAFALTAVGLYGVLAFAVRRRVREIGVRIALGARPAAVIGLVARQGMTLVLIGVALGIAGALAGSRVLESFLYEVSPVDPVTFGGIAALVLALGALACWLPARRAARVDPIEALKAE